MTKPNRLGERCFVTAQFQLDGPEPDPDELAKLPIPDRATLYGDRGYRRSGA